MTSRITAPHLVLAGAVAAAFLSLPVLAAPPAHAVACPAGQVADNRTGICWDATSTGSNVISGTGGVCLPGRIGLCLAGLQNSSLPGGTLRTQPGAGSAPRTGPQGSWP
jgi:hypothetical protein